MAPCPISPWPSGRRSTPTFPIHSQARRKACRRRCSNSSMLMELRVLMASEATLVAPMRPMPVWAKRFVGVALLGLAGLGLQSLKTWHDTHAIFINASESLPNWALLVETGRFPRRGDYVPFDPGRDPLVVKHFGAKPMPFAKIAYGVPGDVVSRQGIRVLVNGRAVARLKPLSRQGEV